MEVVNDNALEIAVGDVAHVDDIARFQVDMAMKSLGYDANGIKITDEITPISNTFTDASKEFQRLFCYPYSR